MRLRNWFGGAIANGALNFPKMQFKMIAVIFHRLGPYHYARLQAASRALPVLAIELSAETSEYAWDKVGAESGFKRVTLFPEGDSRKASPQELAKRLIACLETHLVNVVFIPGWSDKGALAALQWCVRHNLPVMAMSESTEWDETRSAWREAVKRRIVGLCSAALAGGTPHKDYLIKLGMPAERVFLGYDAVDNGYFAREAQRARSGEQGAGSEAEDGGRKAEAGNLPSAIRHLSSGSYFFASARFIEKKNLSRLIEAYARYRELAQMEDGRWRMEDWGEKSESRKQKARNTSPRPSPQCGEGEVPWGLVLLGDGPLKSDLCRLISDLGLQDSVLLPGFKQYPDLPAYYAQAGVFIHASTTEQWGLVVNEAMASGLPVLVSNRCGCAADLVQEGRNGFTFDPYNIEEMANAMMQAWSLEQGARSEMGAKSREIIANWGPERFATGLQSAMRKALAVGPIKPTLLQRMILKALLAR